MLDKPQKNTEKDGSERVKITECVIFRSKKEKWNWDNIQERRPKWSKAWRRGATVSHGQGWRKGLPAVPAVVSWSGAGLPCGHVRGACAGGHVGLLLFTTHHQLLRRPVVSGSLGISCALIWGHCAVVKPSLIAYWLLTLIKCDINENNEFEVNLIGKNSITKKGNLMSSFCQKLWLWLNYLLFQNSFLNLLSIIFLKNSK